MSGAHEPTVTLNGKDVLLFCSNNYLGLANDPRVKQAAIDGITEHGVSVPASRLISGHTSPHKALEARLSAFLGTETSLVFPTGYAANLGVIPAIASEGDVIFSDALNHRSLIDACRLSRAKTVVYSHLDTGDLATKLHAFPEATRRLIVTDGVFSMDGDLAPLDQLADLARTHAATLMVDDAHGTGIFGTQGRGTPELFSVESDVDIWMTSASKGLGTFGGAISGKRALIDTLINRSPSFIYTTALPPHVCSATSAALDVVEQEPERRRHLLKLAGHLRSALTEAGYDICESQSHIIPVRIGDPQQTLDVADFLIDRGIFVLGIRPPTVPEGMSRLRISLMASHTDDHVEHLLGALVEARSEFNLSRPNPCPPPS